MTNQHPITPPSHLLKLWKDQFYSSNKGFIEFLIEAAQWGADQELEACCEWLSVPCPSYGRELRNARRPKTPSLKEQALECLKNINDACESEGFSRSDDTDIIRRALESLPD
jgi:hypothetical protein